MIFFWFCVVGGQKNWERNLEILCFVKQTLSHERRYTPPKKNVLGTACLFMFPFSASFRKCISTHHQHLFFRVAIKHQTRVPFVPPSFINDIQPCTRKKERWRAVRKAVCWVRRGGFEVAAPNTAPAHGATELTLDLIPPNTTLCFVPPLVAHR